MNQLTWVWKETSLSVQKSLDSHVRVSNIHLRLRVMHTKKRRQTKSGRISDVVLAMHVGNTVDSLPDQCIHFKKTVSRAFSTTIQPLRRIFLYFGHIVQKTIITQTNQWRQADRTQESLRKLPKKMIKPSITTYRDISYRGNKPLIATKRPPGKEVTIFITEGPIKEAVFINK